MAIKEIGQSADSIIGIEVSQTAPTNTQVLAYNSTSNKWESTAASSGASLAFKTIEVSGQTDVVADSATDTLTLVAGSNITITTSGDEITIVAADTNTQLTQEQVEDYVNGVIVGGTNVTATYDDAAGTLTLSSTDTNTQTESFKTISVSGQDDVVADSSTDTLTLAAGSNVTITTTAGSDTITIAATDTDTTGGWTDGTNIVTLTTPADKVGLGQATPLVALDVLHDPTGLSGDTGGGESVKFGSGTTVAGKMYYLNSSGAWTLTDANAVASGASQLLAIALGTAPGTHGMLIRGFFDAATYLTGTFVQGAAVYVSETTTGNIDVAAPAGGSDFVRVVGHATTTANVIYFNPSGDWVEL